MDERLVKMSLRSRHCSVLILLAAVLLCVLASSIASIQNASSSYGFIRGQRIEEHGRPFSPSRHVPVSHRPRDETIAKSVVLLWPRKGNSFGFLLHSLHAFYEFPEVKPPGGVPVSDLLEVLTDGGKSREWYGSANTIVATRDGLRHFTDALDFAQAHSDQALAQLAGAGLPLNSRAVASNGKVGSISDFLSDAIARLGTTDEIEWTACAIIHYGSRDQILTNRFGEKFNFDRISQLLVARQVGLASCFGTHANYALALLRQRDDNSSVLTPSVRRRVDQVLERYTLAVKAAQLPNGSIDCNWNLLLFNDDQYLAIVSAMDERLTEKIKERIQFIELGSRLRSPIIDDVVLNTAHQLEWLLLLPPHEQPDAAFFEGALAFLENALAVASDDEIMRSFCAYSHAAHVLLVARRSCFSPQSGDM